MQRTRVNNVRSGLRPVRVGVPQGSLLDPRLFATYVNDLLDHVTIGELYYVIENSVEDIVIILQEVLDQVNSWTLENRLVVHEGKSEAMTLSSKPLIGSMKPLKWGDNVIRYVSSSVCLRITIDDKLSWSQHIKLTRFSFHLKVKMLRRISFLLKSILETI